MRFTNVSLVASVGGRAEPDEILPRHLERGVHAKRCFKSGNRLFFFAQLSVVTLQRFIRVRAKIQLEFAAILRASKIFATFNENLSVRQIPYLINPHRLNGLLIFLDSLFFVEHVAILPLHECLQLVSELRRYPHPL